MNTLRDSFIEWAVSSLKKESCWVKSEHFHHVNLKDAESKILRRLVRLGDSFPKILEEVCMRLRRKPPERDYKMLSPNERRELGLLELFK